MAPSPSQANQLLSLAADFELLSKDLESLATLSSPKAEDLTATRTRAEVLLKMAKETIDGISAAQIKPKNDAKNVSRKPGLVSSIRYDDDSPESSKAKKPSETALPLGLFSTPEKNEDGEQIMEIREAAGAADAPKKRALNSTDTKRASVPISFAPKTDNKQLSKDDLAFLEHLDKWEQIEEAEETSKKKVAKTTKTTAKTKSPSPLVKESNADVEDKALVSVEREQSFSPAEPSAATPAPTFAFRTPADIYTFMSKNNATCSPSTNAPPQPPNLQSPSSSEKQPKSVRFNESVETSFYVPGEPSTSSSQPSSTPLSEPSKRTAPARPIISDTIVEHQSEQPPTEEDLDAYEDFKEVLMAYREKRAKVLGDETAAEVNLLEEIEMPKGIEIVPRAEEGLEWRPRIEAATDQIKVKLQPEPASSSPAESAKASASSAPAPAKKPSRFKAAMQKERLARSS